MDASKILLVICAFTLIVCLTLCITTLAVLRNAVAENGVLQTEANTLVEKLDGCVDRLDDTLSKDSESIEVSGGTNGPDTANGFCLREKDGKIGIYTADGYLVKQLDLSIKTLPKEVREALKAGISVGSWEELLALIADYTS